MNDYLRNNHVNQEPPDPNTVNWTREQGKEEINFTDDYYPHEENEE